MPSWLVILLLCVASWRLTRLIVKDDFPPILWIRDRVCGGWRPLTSKEQGEVASLQTLPLNKIDEARKFWQMTMSDDGQRYVYRWVWVPDWLAELLSCPWCASGWVSAALVAVTSGTVGLPAPFLVWPAVWGASALLASRSWA